MFAPSFNNLEDCSAILILVIACRDPQLPEMEKTGNVLVDMKTQPHFHRVMHSFARDSLVSKLWYSCLLSSWLERLGCCWSLDAEDRP